MWDNVSGSCYSLKIIRVKLNISGQGFKSAFILILSRMLILVAHLSKSASNTQNNLRKSSKLMLIMISS